MSGQDRLRRVREIIARAAALLESPRLDTAGELVAELERSLAELEQLKVQDLGAEGREIAAALREDLRLVTAMYENAASFYQGWARIAAADAMPYTRSGMEPPPDPGASVSLQG